MLKWARIHFPIQRGRSAFRTARFEIEQDGAVSPRTAAEIKLATLANLRGTMADEHTLRRVFQTIVEDKGGQVGAAEITIGRETGWYK